MLYVPYDEIGSRPNVIVDGAATANTVLTLSHWPRSGTPPDLRADSSAEIVFNYLDRPQFHVDAEAVSNNHFDEDGLVGIYAMSHPAAAMAHRDLLVDAAKAGDFGVYETRHGARIAMTLGAYGDADRSPLGRGIFEQPYAVQAAALYRELLVLLPKLLANISDYREIWGDEDELLTDSENLLDRGTVRTWSSGIGTKAGCSLPRGPSPRGSISRVWRTN